MSSIRKLSYIALFVASLANDQVAVARSPLPGLKLADINSYSAALDSNYRHETRSDAILPIKELPTVTLLDTVRHMHKATATSSDGITKEIVYPQCWLEFSRLQTNGG